MTEMTSAMQVLNGENKIKQLNTWHVQIVDWRLTFPNENWQVCAKFFDVTPPWLSSVINSDLFKIYFARRLEIHQEMVSKDVIAAASNTALTGLAVLQRKMISGEHTNSLTDISQTTEMVMKSLGMGVKQPGNAPQVVVNMGAIDQAALEEARKAMKAVNTLNTEEAEVIEESQVNELPPPAMEPELEQDQGSVSLPRSDQVLLDQSTEEIVSNVDNELLREGLASTG